MNKFIKKFLFVTLGFGIMGIGLYYFLIPADLATGGTTGLAMVLKHFFPSISLGWTMFIMNAILFVIAFVVIGPEFGGFTVYASLGLSGFIAIMEKIHPIAGPLTDDLFINLIFGIIIQGLGYALVFREDASTGGTDVVAKIINQFTKLEIGKSLFVADFFIILTAIYAFGFELGLYALLGIFLNSAVIDKAIAGFNVKMSMLIISSEWKEINAYIIEKLDRGSTLYFAQGGYSRQEKVVIQTVVSRKEFIDIKHYAEIIDPKTFISVHQASEVLGEGFTREAES